LSKFKSLVQVQIGSPRNNSIPTKQEIIALPLLINWNSKNNLTEKTWRRDRPMLYLAVGSGRPQEYLASGHSALRNNGIYVGQAIEGRGSEISDARRATFHRAYLNIIKTNQPIRRNSPQQATC
jgi:hypothetical protein